MFGKNENQMTERQLEAMKEIQQQMATGDEEAIRNAWGTFFTETQQALKDEFRTANGNREILAQRGFRQLTTEEKEYYEKLIEVGKSRNPQQSIVGALDPIPATIIEEVFKNLTEEHPLLKKINFQNVGYATKFVLNNHKGKKALWGNLNSSITQEIESGLETIELFQNKLSAFAAIEKDNLDLGPEYLDKYIRTILKEALLDGLEEAVINGTGNGMPLGLMRDLKSKHESNSGDDKQGDHKDKIALNLTDFGPENYGLLLSNLTMKEGSYADEELDRQEKNVDKVTLICNPMDYFEKVMPSSTALTVNGTYATNIFPFPTDVVQSKFVPKGKIILCVAEEYFMGVGTSKEGTIEYSDDFKFLDDKRVFKVKMHAAGRPMYENTSIVCTIDELQPHYMTVVTKPKRV